MDDDLIARAIERGYVDRDSIVAHFGDETPSIRGLVEAGLVPRNDARALIEERHRRAPVADARCALCGGALSISPDSLTCVPCGISLQMTNTSPTESQRVLMPAEVEMASRDPANVYGKYVRYREIGEGGFATVWLAWDRELSRRVALKFLHVRSAEEVARFKREARTAAKLSHPGIVKVYDVGEIRGEHYIAMEFIDGVRESAAMEPRRAAEIVRQAAEAVQYAHEQGIVHRDLKPDNIMISAARAFVADFGLAKLLADDSSFSASGDIMGTPRYMAPEQARGETRNVGPASDVWGLGGSLYFFATGRSPFESEKRDPFELLKRVILEEPPPPRRFNSAIPRQMQTIVLKCLEKNPRRRYASAAALAEDLRRFLDDEPIAASPPSILFRTRKAFEKRRALVAATAAIVLMAIVFGAAAIVQSVRGARREAALREIGSLWSEVSTAKQSIHIPFKDPGAIRASLEDAVTRLDAFVEEYPEYPQGYLVRARANVYLNRLDAAESDLRRAVEIEPSFGPGWALLARVLIQQHTMRLYGDPETAAPREKAAAPLIEEARAALARAGPTDPWGLPRTSEDDVADVLLRALTAAYVRSDPTEGARILAEANAREPSETYCLMLATWTHEARWLDAAVEIAPHFAMAWFDRGNHRLVNGDPAGAIENYDRALRIDPDFAYAWYDRGIASDDAEDFLRAIARRPDFAQAHYALGMTRRSIEDLDRALKVEPYNAVFHDGRGMLLVERGDRAGAMAAFERAIECDPSYSRPYVHRAGEHMTDGAYDRVIADLERAVAHGDTTAATFAGLGMARLRLGDPAGAIADLTRAIEQGGTAVLHAARAQAREEGGDSRGAVEDYRRVVETAPAGSALAEKARQRIDALSDF